MSETLIIAGLFFILAILICIIDVAITLIFWDDL